MSVNPVVWGAGLIAVSATLGVRCDRFKTYQQYSVILALIGSHAYFGGPSLAAAIAVAVWGLASRVRVVGLTGGIGTGKALCTLGAVIIDADVIAREVVRPGRRAYRQILAAFGPTVFLEDGTLNRPVLRKMIMDDPSLRAKMNGATHLNILLEIFKQILWLRLVKRHDFVVLDAPLLFETGLQHVCCWVVVVACPRAVQVQRVVRRDAVTAAEAERSVAAQLPLDVKMAAADFVIDNSGTLDDLGAAVADVVKQIAR